MLQNDDNLFWIQDALHAPQPLTPISQVLMGDYLAEGFNHAFSQLGFSYRIEIKFVNYYYYMAIPALQSYTDETIKQEKAYEAKQLELVGRFSEDWHGKYLPEIKQLGQKLKNNVLNNLSLENLLKYFAEYLSITSRLWTLHGLIFIPMFLAPSLFQEQNKQTLSGLSHNSTQMATALWEIRTLIMDSKLTMHQIKDKVVLTKINQFLEHYGQRNEHFLELNPTFLGPQSDYLELNHTICMPLPQTGAAYAQCIC